MDTASSQLSSLNPIILVISFVLTAALFIFMFSKIIKAIKKSKEKKQPQQSNPETNHSNATISGTLKHFNGLPVPENTSCQINSTKDAYQILCQGQQFNLAKEKVLNISITTDTEIQKQYVSSAGGAIGGALLFGPVGALIGGRTKAKTKKEVYTYLIFTYLKGEEPQYIAFDSTDSYFLTMKILKEFEAQKPREAYQIEL